MEEVWKPIPYYEGLYEVSNLGRVKSLNYNRTGKPQVMSQRIDKGGYCYIKLFNKNHQQKFEKVHRLVALAFIPNPNGYPCVNHKDEIKTNNSVNNLEWCTHHYNNAYGTRGNRISCTRMTMSVSGSLPENRQVKCVETGQIFGSIAEAERSISKDGKRTGKLDHCLAKGPEYTSGGYHWQYIN